MRKLVLWAVVLGVLSRVEAKAAEGVTTGTAITSIEVTQNGQVQQWTIVMKGTITLGTGCKLNNYRIALTDPNGNALAPTLTFTTPAAGQTSSFTATLTTTTKGNWNGSVSLGYTNAAGTKCSCGTGQQFMVPSP